MTEAELCKSVAVEVFTSPADKSYGWRLTWEDAGLVVEAMRAKGWKFSVACDANGKWRAVFWPSGSKYLSLEDTVVADTMPRAVFLASLEAGRASGGEPGA